MPSPHHERVDIRLSVIGHDLTESQAREDPLEPSSVGDEWQMDHLVVPSCKILNAGRPIPAASASAEVWNAS